MRINKHKKRVYMWKKQYKNEWDVTAIITGSPDCVEIIGYDFINAIISYRSFHNRSWYLPPHQDKNRIESTRIWQIKNKLNYGRY